MRRNRRLLLAISAVLSAALTPPLLTIRSTLAAAAMVSSCGQTSLEHATLSVCSEGWQQFPLVRSLVPSSGMRASAAISLCLPLCVVGRPAAVLAGASRSVPRDTPPTSLIAVTGAQLQDARKVLPNAALFEVRAALTSQDLATGIPHIGFAFGDFTSPGDDVRFVEVSEWFGHQGSRTVQTLDYVRVVCNGGPARADCGQGTGRPEARQKHLPLRGWRLDLPGVVRIVRADRLLARTPMSVTVTTAGRAGLPALPAGRAIIKVLEAPSSSGRPGAMARFIILDAANGSVIQRGIYRAPPPAA